MAKKELSSGVVHKIPFDMQKALTSSPATRIAWNNLTPLARNEWICWVTSVKKPETRKQHIERVCTDLVQGKRRPCCWPGCIHR
ncbi:YdeI/OmpD-associated family protein [Candidatus Woesearchaeota archaeon]|nr:YdeI/OmpD-associated family protein [Candidatus Woesearchaeota archaeon]